MKVSEIRAKSEDEIKSLIVDSKKEAFNLRFQKVTGELENTGRIKEVRRTIARAKTLLAAGEFGKAESKKPAKKAVAKKAEAKKPAAKKAAAKKPAAKKTTKKSA